MISKINDEYPLVMASDEDEDEYFTLDVAWEMIFDRDKTIDRLLDENGLLTDLFVAVKGWQQANERPPKDSLLDGLGSVVMRRDEIYAIIERIERHDIEQE